MVLRRVSNSIGWVEKYNVVSAAYPKSMTDGQHRALELDVPAFADGRWREMKITLTATREEQIRRLYSQLSQYNDDIVRAGAGCLCFEQDKNS